MFDGHQPNSVLEILDEVSQTASTNEKQEILKKHKHNKELEETFNLAYNPFYTFGIKKIPEYRVIGGATTLMNVYRRLNVLYDGIKTGNEAIEWLAHEFEGLEQEDAEVLERVIKRDLRCGVSAKIANKVWPNLIPEFPNMLASGMKEETLDKIDFPAYVQEKLDGQRVNIIVKSNGNVTVRTRNGKELDYLNSYFASDVAVPIQSNVVLDGELLVQDTKGNFLSRKKSNGILNKVQKGTAKENELNSIVAVIWDIIPYESFMQGKWNEPYSKRLSILSNFLDREDVNQNGSMKLIDTQTVESMHEARNYFMWKLKEGAEGAILKDMSHVWENGRSKQQVKMKAEKEADLHVINYEEGRGKYKGFLGNFIASTSDGKLEVSIGSGFSDQQRDEYFDDWVLDKIVTVRYNEVIEKDDGSKSLYLPIFHELRDDKFEANSLEEL